MTVEEIFKKLLAHQIKGVMTHEQLANYYDFMNLHGYKRCHEYHAKREFDDMRKLQRYYINHFNKLIEEERVNDPEIIPASWYKYTRQEVDASTKRQAVKTGVEKWVEWETETKRLYEDMYNELLDLGEVAAAQKIACFVCAVDKELKWAQRKHINLLASDYNISYILGEQDHLHDWYKKKMRKGHDKH